MAKIRLVADSKLFFKATILVLLGLAVFLLLNYSSRFFNRDASGTDLTLESELELDKRTIGDVEDNDLSFPWDYEYDKEKINECSYYNSEVGSTYFCVPHFVVVGGRCSGQQRLFNLLQMHQKVYNTGAGTNYFSKFNSTDDLTFEGMIKYVSLFHDATTAIKEDNKLTFGDAGNLLVHDYIVPGLTHSGEPPITVLQYLYHLNKNLKVFYAVHNPIAMFECCWCTEKKKDNSIPNINEVALSAIDDFENCHPPYSEGRCTLVLDYLEGPEKCIIPGLEYYFYNSLLGTVKYDNIKIVHFTDITKDSLRKRMIEYSIHLGIESPTEANLGEMESILNVGANQCEYGLLDYETRDSLRQFYKNSLDEMNRVTKDNRFQSYLSE